MKELEKKLNELKKKQMKVDNICFYSLAGLSLGFMGSMMSGKIWGWYGFWVAIVVIATLFFLLFMFIEIYDEVIEEKKNKIKYELSSLELKEMLNKNRSLKKWKMK